MAQECSDESVHLDNVDVVIPTPKTQDYLDAISTQGPTVATTGKPVNGVFGVRKRKRVDLTNLPELASPHRPPPRKVLCTCI